MNTLVSFCITDSMRMLAWGIQKYLQICVTPFITTHQVSNTSLKIDVTFCVHLIVTKINPTCTQWRNAYLYYCYHSDLISSIFLSSMKQMLIERKHIPEYNNLQ